MFADGIRETQLGLIVFKINVVSSRAKRSTAVQPVNVSVVILSHL